MKKSITRTMSAHVVTAAAALSLLITSVQAEISNKVEVDQLAQAWAETTYQRPVSVHTKELGTLSKQAKASLIHAADDPELLTWAGIITASYAGSKGGLGALKLAKRAKQYFEHAMQIDPDALDGGARTSLGALYYQVPGWPIGFGNNDKAEALLAESANKHPQNINALYFYADFLLSQKRFNESQKIFNQASTLPIRENATIADSGRQQQIKDKLVRLAKILG